MMTGRISVALSRPQYPRNVGMCARALANMGGAQLIVIDPRCSISDEAAKQGAAGAQEPLRSAIAYPTWAEFLAAEGGGILIGLSGKDGRLRTPDLLEEKTEAAWRDRRPRAADLGSHSPNPPGFWSRGRRLGCGGIGVLPPCLPPIDVRRFFQPQSFARRPARPVRDAAISRRARRSLRGPGSVPCRACGARGKTRSARPPPFSGPGHRRLARGARVQLIKSQNSCSQRSETDLARK